MGGDGSKDLGLPGPVSKSLAWTLKGQGDIFPPDVSEEGGL